MTRTSAAVGTDACMTLAAQDVLIRSASAVDACLAGWFAAAGKYRGVCLGSVSMLVAGTGSGTYLIDGSVLQPGLGAPRPRGFVNIADIPELSRVAVSPIGGWLLAAHAHGGSLSLGELAARGVKLARDNQANQRANLLRHLALAGPLALRETLFVRSFLQVAARAQGGNVTTHDLERAEARVISPVIEDGLIHLAPVCPDQMQVQQQPVKQPDPRQQQSYTESKYDHGQYCLDDFAARATRTLVMVACDHRGLWAAIHCAFDDDGVPIGSYDVTASRYAIPVMRGVARVRPGTRIVHPSPIAMLTNRTRPWAAIGWQGVKDASWKKAVKQLGCEALGDDAEDHAAVSVGGVMMADQMAEFAKQHGPEARLIACVKGGAPTDTARVYDTRPSM